jgi:hypothetical protein
LATGAEEEDAGEFFFALDLLDLADVGDDFDLAEAGLEVFARGADAAGAGKGATWGNPADGTTPACGEDCKSAEDKSAERLGRAEFGTTGGAAIVAPLGKAVNGATCAGDADGFGVASKRLRVFKFKSTNSSDARSGPFTTGASFFATGAAIGL